MASYWELPLSSKESELGDCEQALIAANVDFATVDRGLGSYGETLNKTRYGKLAYSP
jgi:hypothetical protein